MARDTIIVEGLEFDCIVGVRPDEREREQTVRLDLELQLDLVTAAQSGRISDTCDYDDVVREVTALLRFRRYKLIEMAVQELATMLLGLHEPLQALRVRLEKPRALEGRARSAAVQIQRERGDLPRRTEDARFGLVEVLGENREAGLYLLHIAPGRSIPPHYHRVMRELEWLVSGVLLRDGLPARRLQPVTWPRGQVHSYENTSTQRATLFCCDTPPFIPDDEVLVEQDP